MMSLIDDWKVYVQEPSRFDEHHFESLMSELETPEQIHSTI